MEDGSKTVWNWIVRLVIVPVTTLILLIFLLSGPVPMMIATVDKTNADTTSGAISRLLGLGYQVWGAPGTTVSTDLNPSTNNTYTNGSQALQWANGWYNNFNVTGKVNITSLNATAASSTTLVTDLNADLLDGQHAPSGTIVGTTDSQVLTNKSLTSPSITGVVPSANITDLISGNLTAATGRGAYLIALSDAPALIKNQADVIVSGDADDEIRAAIAAGWSTIRISQGTGTISANITLPTATRAVDIGGAGVDSTNLTMTDSANDDMFIIGSGAATVEAAGSLHDMTLDMNKANNTQGSAIKAISGLQDHVWNLRLKDSPDYNLYVQGASSSVRPDYFVQDGQFWSTGAGKAEIHIGKWSNAGSLISPKVADGVIGISFNGSSADWQVVNSQAWQHTGYGYQFSNNVAKVSMVNPESDGTGLEAISLDQSTGITIRGGILTAANTSNTSGVNVITYGRGGEAKSFILDGIVFIAASPDNPAYAIGGTGSGGNGAISNMQIRLTSGKGIQAVDTSVVRLSNNMGVNWKDRAFGTLTIAAGTGSISGAHSMGNTPTRATATFAANPGVATSLWVTYNSTNVTVSVSTNVTGNTNVLWEAFFNN